MARKANIVSFDDARSASRRRSSGKNDASTRRQADAYTSPYASVRASDYVEPNSDYSEFDDFRSRQHGAASTRQDRSLDADNTRSKLDERLAKRAKRASSASEGEKSKSEKTSTSSRRARRSDQRAEKQRKRSKARAEKLFDRQFASEPAKNAAVEGEPRAALYEAKMGSKHRKSARMQKASTALPQTAKIDPIGWLANINVPTRSLKIGTAVLCLILTGLFLYVPAQQYYQSLREHDKLVAEYAYIEQRNDSLEVQNAALASNAGMEDAVRQRYGYAKNGDQVIVVTGLSDQATDTSRDSENIEANVLSSAVKAPEQWYTPFLDAFFGVS